MSNVSVMTKSSKENPKVRLPPKRGQIKVRIFRLVAKKVADIASTARLGRKKSCVTHEPDSATPLEISACSPAKHE
ncbi:hypothetical protein ACJRO7_028886 [Eucalyptus globulus]|uniref:Uncharacterized protein n=1 Tax=Eucalyptus globulus TaxID=34317 RepID=A0ABD3JZS9_EUCGL